jgi:membrane fusion protein (multidrug efflux system)
MIPRGRSRVPAARPRAEFKVALSRRKIARWGAVVLVLVVGGFFGARYWLYSRNFQSTDDAYVGAHTVDISAEVAGQVAQVFVSNNDIVHAGQPLFELDRRPYEIARERAQAELAQRLAEARNAGHNNARMRVLVKGGFLSPQGGEASETQVQTANAAVKDAQAALDQAQLDLQRARVTAPADGVIGNMSLRPGAPVQPRTPLFVLISDKEFWVDANFKETQLGEIQPGQSATVKLDMYPKQVFHGVVESLSGGAGTAFSLLPPQNATGNWVKVTQRVPVRVRITDPDPQHPLRIGTTAKVEIAVRDGGAGSVARR